MKNKALGKGLSAIISQNALNDSSQGYLPAVSVNKILPNPYQPRIEISKKSVESLADSIKEHGVIEPLIVTKSDKDEYELIAGERRLEAAKVAKLKTVPVVIKEASPQQMLELAVVENIQRADLNPLEEGAAFNQLVELFNMTHGEISEKVGLSRSGIANKIRLLKLPLPVKEGLLRKKIEEGHARALLGLTEKNVLLQAYKITIRDHLSVRAVEELVRRLNSGHKKPHTRMRRILDQKTKKIETSLQKRYTSKLSLSRSRSGGKIVIPFSNDKELDKIYDKLLSK